MEYLLIITVIFSLTLAAFCSLSEAALFAVPLPHVKHAAEQGSPAGKLLEDFKSDMGRPISAILILNTIATTTGSAIAGAAAENIFGQTGLIVFAVLMSSAMLFVGEIIPKFIGVSYPKQISEATAKPLAWLIRIFGPLIKVANLVTEQIEPEAEEHTVSHEEVLSMAAIGAEEGALDHLEGSVISNVIALDKILVRDILTPRVMVFRVLDSMTVREAQQEILDWNFSRVPTYREEDPDHLSGYVRQRDIFREAIQGRFGKTLSELARPLHTVPELMRADKLLLHMFEERQHICAVVDEHGGLAGIITLEDILEEVVGREIVDEYDVVR